jgi:hypothetical protein
LTPNAILWRRLDRPGYEAARLVRQDTGWLLTGNAAFKHEGWICSLTYAIHCDEGWHTTKTTITGWTGDQTIVLEVLVDANRRWHLNGREAPLVRGCIDIDLAFSPSTNLLPIRRLNLRPGEEAEVRASWLRFPELTLAPLDQQYRCIDDSTYQYESGHGSFRSTLRTNDVGLVVWYPDFWVALDDGPAA